MNKLMRFSVETEDVFDRQKRFEIIKKACVEYTSSVIEKMMNSRIVEKKKIVKNMWNNLKIFENKFLETSIYCSFMMGLFENNFETNFKIFFDIVLCHNLYIESVLCQKPKKESMFDSAKEISKIFYVIYNQLK